MKLSYYNKKQISRDLTKGKGLSKSAVELFESVLFWALQNNTTKKTICVSGKTASLVFRLAEAGLVKVIGTGGSKVEAELLGEWELNTKFYS